MEYAGRLLKSEWEVREITSFAAARKFIIEHHYARGASNTAVHLHALFKRGETAIYGIAWWLPPTKAAAISTFPENWQGVLSLSRLAVSPACPKNAATFLLANSMKLIDRSKWPCFVTYADEWQGHTGTIYRASNWDYAGRTKPQRIYVKDGRMIARKAGPKTRTHDEMVALGAECIGQSCKHKFVLIKRVRTVAKDATPAQRDLFASAAE